MLRFAPMALAAAISILAAALPAMAQQTPAPAPAKPADPATVIATVQGTDITVADLMLMVETLPPQYRQAPMEMVYDALLKQLIERRLVALAAEKSGLADDADFKRRLAFSRDALLHRTYLRARVEPELKEDKLRARYDREIKSAGGEEEVHARHILVETEDAAKGVIKELQAGADFAAVAKEKSTGPSGAKGGDLGFFKRGDMVPEFSKAAFALGVGEISEPVETQFGWHVIKVEERRKAPVPTLEESMADLREAAAKDAVDKALNELTKDAKITAFNLDGTPRETPKLGVE